MSDKTSFVPIWTQIEQLLEKRVSLIPIWDSDREVDGESFAKKAACFKWDKYKSKIISKQELWSQMEKAKTTAVAIVCGAVSGNLEIIDIDVKNRIGIDAELFDAINTLYPSIFKRLRIHKTPSGGYHILYRVTGGAVPGSQKLAWREKTEDEIRLSPKVKKLCYIETRGEGGYAAAPPSLGYEVHIENDFPVLTWEERSSLITLCQTFSLLIREEPKYTPQKSEISYYDESPFEHYNRTCDPISLMKEGGWTFVKQSGNYLWFSRPGAKNPADVHGTFIISKRCFYIWSTNAGLEADRGYLPSTVYAYFKHSGDKKATYSSLVSLGYGRIKPSIEKRLVKTSVIRSKPLPENASQEAQTEYLTSKALFDEQHPHGIFWTLKEERIEIERERLYGVAEALGFRCWQQEVVRISEYKVFRMSEREFYDEMKEYIHEEDGDLYIKICNAYEAFIQNNGRFTMTRLALLDTTLLLSDTKTTCYKFYLNCYIEITKNDIHIHEYSEIKKRLVWSEKIQQREYISSSPASCAYCEFLAKAVANDEDHIQSVIGYLAHEYKDETIGYIIVLVEECEDPKEGGGTGKNIFSSLFSYTTTFRSTPGAMMKYDEKFLQSWNYEKILGISDVTKKFDFSFLNEFTTGAGKLKKLFKDELTIPVELMPKFIISTNFSYEVSNGGLARRIIPLEFTDFFTKKGGVDVYFGKHFPKDWTEDDWHGYDFYIIGCIQTWLKSNLKLSQEIKSSGGKKKQFIQSYGQTLQDFFSENIDNWCADVEVEITKFRAAYHKYCDDNEIKREFQASMIKINSALAAFCEERRIYFEPSYQWSSGGVKLKGKLFRIETPF